jgi:RNA polymerase sigma-70 factor (family 1)
LLLNNKSILKREEFKKIFDTYFEDVRRFVLYRSGDAELATDIAQDTFLKVWEKQFDVSQPTIKALLFKIANDLFINHYRKGQTAFKFFKTFIPDTKPHASPEEELNYKELEKAYEKALETMPETQRVVFLMSRIDELKYQEMADQLGLSVKAVEKRMSLALSHLRECLRDKISTMVLFILQRFKPLTKTKELKT